MDWQATRQFLSPCFPQCIRDEMDLLMPGELREIRIRADKPTIFVTATRVTPLDWRPGQVQIAALLEALTGRSLYTRGHETSQGYVTLEGGHRVGICGRVIHRRGQSSLQEPASLCIRIACQWPGCADPLIAAMKDTKALPCPSVLVIGPPGSGKTTLLRDAAKQLASGPQALQTAIIDERGELAACMNGVPQLDVGGAADVLDGLPKTEAVPWLIRSMAPQVIVMDELAGEEDAACVMEAVTSGTPVLASLHGSDLTDAASRPAIAALMARRVFGLYAVMDPTGGIRSLHSRSGQAVTGP